jgi:hypothetical protein
MKRNSIKILIVTVLVGIGSMSCNKNKIIAPNDQVTAAQVYGTPLGYKQSLAKVYAAFALTGSTGPSGSGDVQGIDEGTSDFFRLFWCAQQLPTDETVLAWGDPGIPDFHNMTWSSSNPILTGLYYRSLYQITLCNAFINQSSDANLSANGLTGADATEVHHYVAEARFLRAYQYWVLMDLFGNPPFISGDVAVGSTIPKQISRAALFSYIESELKAIDPLLVTAGKNEYGRADQAAAWALLARIYLNAQVYTGTAKYTDAITYSQKVIGAGYTLIPKYINLMLADNNVNNTEAIFTINYDGAKTQGYGGTTFLKNAQLGGSMPSSLYGTSQKWGGIRVTKNLVNLFPTAVDTSLVNFPTNKNPDTRAEFWTRGQNLEINDVTSFTDGYAVNKFRNVTSSGTNGSDLTFSDIDMPLFRLSEMYLIYAEAVLRGGTGGDAGTALTYVNKIRTRAYGSAVGNITSGALTTDFILDERARELYWEGFRRTDLVRYDKFTTASYVWPFKGGAKAGTSVGAYRNLYPIPDQDRAVNPNLKQNTGY